MCAAWEAKEVSAVPVLICIRIYDLVCRLRPPLDFRAGYAARTFHPTHVPDLIAAREHSRPTHSFACVLSSGLRFVYYVLILIRTYVGA